MQTRIKGWVSLVMSFILFYVRAVFTNTLNGKGSPNSSSKITCVLYFQLRKLFLSEMHTGRNAVVSIMGMLCFKQRITK